MKIREIGLLILCILITLGAGGLGGFATATSIDGWYATINKPSFNPPNYLFGPVWTFLYFLMGLALFVIIRLPKSTRKNSMLVIFIIQLVFGNHKPFFWIYALVVGASVRYVNSGEISCDLKNPSEPSFLGKAERALLLFMINLHKKPPLLISILYYL